MKKSEFKKLKVGDLVRVRRFDELTELSCFGSDHVGNFLIDDNDFARSILPNRHILGKVVEVENLDNNSRTTIQVRYRTARFFVTRQFLENEVIKK